MVLAQRNGVEPPKKSAFLPRRIHHSRERYKSVVYTFLARLGEGAGGLPGAQVSLTQSAVMLGLRVRGRGGRDRTAPVAAPISAFLWGSTPFLCARAKKWGGTGSRGRRLLTKKTAHTCKAKDKAASSLPSACAPLLWEVVVALSCFSTPFLWCLPKETVSSRQRKALFLPWCLHHSRERFCLSYLYSSSPDCGEGLVG